VLAGERIIGRSKRSPETASFIRRIYNKRQQFAKFFGALNELNEVVAGFFPLLQEEPDETVLSYLELKEKLRATHGSLLPAPPGATSKDLHEGPKRPRSDLQRKQKRRAQPKLNYYRPAAAAVIDRITRGKEFRVWTVPVSIKEQYEQHGRELAKAQRSWLQFAKETWPKKSTMRWVPSEQDGLLLGYLTQKVIDPVSNPPEMTLIEEAQEEHATIASLLLDVSCSMQVDDRYELAYMIADRLSDFLTKGDISSEVIGHTTTV
jgi:hypothetical protein